MLYIYYIYKDIHIHIQKYVKYIQSFSFQLKKK